MRFSKGFLHEIFFIALHPWVKRSRFGLDGSSRNALHSALKFERKKIGILGSCTYTTQKVW